MTTRLRVLEIAAMLYGTKLDPAMESHRALFYDMAADLLDWAKGLKVSLATTQRNAEKIIEDHINLADIPF